MKSTASTTGVVNAPKDRKETENTNEKTREEKRRREGEKEVNRNCGIIYPAVI